MDFTAIINKADQHQIKADHLIDQSLYEKISDVFKKINDIKKEHATFISSNQLTHVSKLDYIENLYDGFVNEVANKVYRDIKGLKESAINLIVYHYKLDRIWHYDKILEFNTVDEMIFNLKIFLKIDSFNNAVYEQIYQKIKGKTCEHKNKSVFMYFTLNSWDFEDEVNKLNSSSSERFKQLCQSISYWYSGEVNDDVFNMLSINNNDRISFDTIKCSYDNIESFKFYKNGKFKINFISSEKAFKFYQRFNKSE